MDCGANRGIFLRRIFQRMMVLPPFRLEGARRSFHPRGQQGLGGVLGGMIPLLLEKLLQSLAVKNR